MKHFVLTMIAIGSAMSWAHSQALSPTELFGDPILARVNDVAIRQSEVDKRFTLHQGSSAARGTRIQDQDRAQIESQLLDKIITHQLLLAHATEADKTKAQQRVGEMLQELRDRAKDEAAFKRHLLATGMDEDQLKEQLLENAINEVILNKELRSTIQISEEAVQAYYDGHPEEFKKPERVSAAHLMLSRKDAQGRELPEAALKEQRQRAEDLRDRARKGEDIKRLIRLYSDDKSSLPDEGIYTFSKNQINPRISAAAFSLQLGQTSDIVETSLGFHVLQLVERFPSELIPLAEVKDKIKEHLTLLEMKERLPSFMEGLKAKAKVEILKESPKR